MSDQGGTKGKNGSGGVSQALLSLAPTTFVSARV